MRHAHQYLAQIVLLFHERDARIEVDRAWAAVFLTFVLLEFIRHCCEVWRDDSPISSDHAKSH